MSEEKQRFDENCKRITSLLMLYDSDIKSNEDVKKTDILRACVVFTHSIFEDYFREVLYKMIIMQHDVHILQDIPLHEDNRDTLKFNFSNLIQYKDEKISNLIEKSVKQYLGSKSFNDLSDIFRWCSKINFNIDEFSDNKAINEFILRRHKIVHEADFDSKFGKLRKIDKSYVTKNHLLINDLVKKIDLQFKNYINNINNKI